MSEQITTYEPILNLAEILEKSSILPTHSRGAKYTKHDIFVLACIGQRLGIDPLASVMGIYIVEGRPFIGSRLVRALVLKNGHKFEIKEWTSTSIKVTAARAGGPDQEFSYSIAEATHAGLTGKSSWKQHPRRMLLAAVTRNVADAIFADIFLGVTTDDGSGDGIEDNQGQLAKPTESTITLESLAVTGGGADAHT
jgi:hypothetical protein